MKFNYSNLDATDFELLSKDIIERITGVTMRTFAPGRDSGIDVKGLEGKNIFAQCKHFLKSPFSSLKSSMKTEIPKVNAINPPKYYVTTSMNLTSKNIEEIYSMFTDYMDNSSFVIDLGFIDNFLGLNKNSDILLKHPKLWFFSHEVLMKTLNTTIVSDSLALIQETRSDSISFVRTSCFWDSLNTLKKNNVVLLTGDAGVGKTITSKIISCILQLEGYKLIHHSGNDYNQLRREMTENEEVKELVFLDDFLGQSYLELNSSAISPLNSLIKSVKRSKNKKLIINSRITVLNSAKSTYVDLDRSLSSAVEEYEINMNNICDLEKAEILYNTFIRFEVPKDKFLSIKKNKRYKIIVNHKNYTPRTVEYFCFNHSEYTEINYYKFVINTLSDAYEVWENEFTQKIDNNDRLYLTILYSLGQKKIEENIFIEALNKYISDYHVSGFDYEVISKRLENSMIRNLFDNSKKYVTLKNPSVYDYMGKKLSRVSDIRDRVLKKPLYLNQVSQLLGIIEVGKQRILSYLPNIFKFVLIRSEPLDIFDVFADNQYDIIYKHDIKNHIYDNYFNIEYLSKKKIPYGVYNIMENYEFVEFYEIPVYDTTELFIDYYQDSDLQQFIRGIEVFEEYKNENIERDLLIFEMNKKIESFLDKNFSDYLQSEIEYGDLVSIIEKSTLSRDCEGNPLIPSSLYNKILVEVESQIAVELIEESDVNILDTYSEEYFKNFENYDFSSYIENQESYIIDELQDHIYHLENSEPNLDSLREEMRLDECEPSDEDPEVTVDSIFEREYPIE